MTAAYPERADASAQFEATPQWSVRFTWEALRGSSHPKYTYATLATESEAIDHAVQILDNYNNDGSVRLVEIHAKGPGRDWSRVE